MTANHFAATCSSFGVDPSIALENDEIYKLLLDDASNPSVENQSRLERILCENF